jgi:hypothetical protein
MMPKERVAMSVTRNCAVQLVIQCSKHELKSNRI